MSDPTTTEWTADTVFNLLMSQEDDHLAHEAVADAHNAALAAEREKYVEQREDWISEIQKLQEQFAAEREYGSAVTGASISAEDVIQQLKEQLAVERNARQLAEHNMTNWHQAALRDSAKLDAAIEALTIIRDKIYQIAGAKKIATTALKSIKLYQEIVLYDAL